MKEGKFMGATDECFEGLGIGFGMVIGLFAIIFSTTLLSKVGEFFLIIPSR